MSTRQSERSTYAAIGWIRRGDDGPSFGWDHAKVRCHRCLGFEGTVCPAEDCSVQIVSTQAEHDARYREEMRQEEERRQRERAERRARRDLTSRGRDT